MGSSNWKDEISYLKVMVIIQGIFHIKENIPKILEKSLIQYWSTF
jgi:hypothetical protein